MSKPSTKKTTKEQEEKRMTVRRRNEELYQTCFRDYIHGSLTTRAVAEKHGVPFGTLQHWAFGNDWNKAREDFFESINKKISNKVFEECASRACQVVLNGLENSKILTEFVGLKLNKLRQVIADTDEDKMTLGKYIRECTEIARLAQIAASTYRAYTPDISADIAEKMIASLDKIKIEKVETSCEKS